MKQQELIFSTPPGDSIAIHVVIIVISLGLPALFSSSETILTTAGKTRIRTLAEGGNKPAQWVMKLSENQGRMLSAILISDNVVNFPASSILTVLVTEMFGNRAAGAATDVPTFLILIFGEVTPKAMATLEAKRYSLRVGHITHILMTMPTSPIILINRMSLIALKALYADPDKRSDDITEDEFRTIVDVGHEKGIIEPEEREMTNNVFDLGDSVTKDIMVPRIDMMFVGIEADYNDLIQIFKEEYYTRLPVYKETTDNMVGIINIKDPLLMEDKVSFCVSDYLCQPFCTFEPKELSELVTEIKKSSNNIIIVLDGYGATIGFITLEDILEEIVGDIRNKYDEDEEEELMDLGDGRHLVEGSMKLDDPNSILDLELSSEDYDSVGSLIIDCLEHLPSRGEKVMCGNVRLVMKQMGENRIDKIYPYILPKEKEENIEGRRNGSQNACTLGQYMLE